MRILITGGGGRIGRAMRRELQGRYDRLRLLDRLAIDDLGPDEEALQGDIAEIATVERAMEGVDGVIHMAGIPYEAPIEEMLPTNIVGTFNIYEAARRQGAKRVVFGSSNHATGFYPRAQRIDNAVPVRPDTNYGLTKCWGEAIGHLYADKHGIKSLHLRIGSFTPLPENERGLSLWLSARDLAQLCRIGLEHPDIHSDVVYGVSDNARSWYDNSHASRLGYAPQDRSEDHVEHAMRGEALLKREPADRHFQGGPFCAIAYEGGPIPPISRTGS